MRKQAAAMRGQGSEPVELRPGIGARDAAHFAEVEQWAWRRGRAPRGFFSHLTAFVIINFVLFLIELTKPRTGWVFSPLIGLGLVGLLPRPAAFQKLALAEA